MAVSPTDVTRLLHEASGGNQEAFDRLLPLVYDELRAIAHGQRRSEPAELTLNTTALVHEAYLKLVDQTRVTWRNRAHFFAIASRSIRRIVIDRARERLAQKRGGGAAHISIEQLDVESLGEEQADVLVGLDEALSRLAAVDPRQGEVVTYRFFGGLTIEETAEVLGVSPATVKREWAMAKAWLHRELSLGL
jgi:RNA polymerase sigma factor (TIGR02999 family)